jgi:protein-tyrosine phosphatase
MRTSRLFFIAVTMLIPAWPADQVAGIPNFRKVKTVIDLRLPDEHSTAAEARAVEAAGMRYVHIPMKGFSAPTDEQVSKVMALLEEGNVFVHCRRGADRTGTVMACYRVRHDGWDNERALKEAKACGMRWVEWAMKGYVMAYRAPAGSAPAGRVVAALP